MISKLTNLKQELISLSEASDIGFNYTQTAKEQIETLAASLETLNPTNEPTNKMDLVQGRWRLLYSTFGLERETTLQRLSFGKLPNVKVNVTGIFQEVDTVAHGYNNLIEFTAASGVHGTALVLGSYTVESSQRLNVDFWGTSVKSSGNNLSDSALRHALGIDSNSPLKSDLSFNGWVDITYLDDNFRLVRGNQKNLYVLLRED